MADDGYVTIHRTTDVAQGDMLAEMFKREGIPARFHKVSSTLIGMPSLLIEMNVDVPAASEARARELLRDLEYTAAADAVDADQAEDPDPPPSRWRAVMRAGFTLFLPGSCHLYAGRPWTALVLFLAGAGCVAVAVVADSGSVAFGAALATVFALMLCDMIGGVRAAWAETGGARVGRARQLGSGLLLLLVAGALGGAARTAMAAPGWWRARLLTRFTLTCTKAGLLVNSQDGDDREVIFGRVGIRTTAAGGGEVIHDVRLPLSSTFRLRAGATGRLPFVPDPDVAAACAAGAPCRVVFTLSIEAVERGPLPLRGEGECTPGWGATSDDVPGRLTLSASDGE